MIVSVNDSQADLPPLTLILFGPMQVLVHGRPLPPLRSRKALWLLALLALRQGRPVEREWLTETLWPDTDRLRASANLRVVLSELRRALGDQADLVQSLTRSALRLDISRIRVDVIEFDDATVSQNQEELRLAVALYQGPLLEDCSEEWITQERLRRERICLQALGTLAGAAFAAGDAELALRYFQQSVDIDPLSEASQRGLMEALALSGDRNAAMEVYQGFARLLRREDPQAVPDEQTNTLYARLRAEARQRSSIPPITAAEEASIPVLTGYLPQMQTDLVGRHEERLEVTDWLRRSRLVTLTGPGGIGKTRLAIAVAAEAVLDHPDGVWFVALESLSQGQQVIGQIRRVLGLLEEPGRSLLDGLADSLRAKRLLLVLDNCEHLVEASAQVASHLLRDCAGVRILATSREALGITGETAWAVPALSVPDAAPVRSDRSMQALMGYESVQLFVQRARLVQRTFALTGNHGPMVTQICSQLEGIPLAIELAAARVTSMTMDQMAGLVDHHLDLLAGGSGAGLSRQQTLRATLDWSYDLLTEPERFLLTRLSVFAGGWTLEAAEQVCCSEDVPAWEVLDLLTLLVDKSLVVFEMRDTEQYGRYRLLETVRRYAAECLEFSGESAVYQSRHRDYFLALAEDAEHHLKGGEQKAWLQRLDGDYANLRASLVWDEDGDDGAGKGLRLAAALFLYWYIRGYYREGRDYLAQTLMREGAQAMSDVRARALKAAGSLAYRQGDYPTSRAFQEEVLHYYRDQGHLQGIAVALLGLGNVANDQSNYEAARALYEESLSLMRQAGKPEQIAVVLRNLAGAAQSLGDQPSVQALYGESLTLYREIGNEGGMAAVIGGLGEAAYSQGDLTTAQMLYEESLRLFQELGEKAAIDWVCLGLGHVALAQDDLESAQGLYEQCQDSSTKLGDRRNLARSQYGLGRVARGRENLRSALTWHLKALEIRASLGEQAALADSLEGIAMVLLAQADARKATQLWGAAYALRQSIHVPIYPIEQRQYDRNITQARTLLGESAFAAAWEEGRAMTWEQAVTIALETSDSR